MTAAPIGTFSFIFFIASFEFNAIISSKYIFELRDFNLILLSNKLNFTALNCLKRFSKIIPV